MRQTIAVRDEKGNINRVYLTDSDSIVSKQKLIDSDDYIRGIAQVHFQTNISKEMEKTHVPIGTKAEKLKNGYLFRVFFMKKGEFEIKEVNDIVGEWMENWQEEFGGYNSQSQAKRINIQKRKKVKAL